MIDPATPAPRTAGRGQHRLQLAGALLAPTCPGSQALVRIQQLSAAAQAELRECVDWVEEYEQFEQKKA